MMSQKLHLMDGVEETPLEVGESHGDVPRVDPQQSDRLLSQLRTLGQGRLRHTHTHSDSGFKPQALETLFLLMKNV